MKYLIIYLTIRLKEGDFLIDVSTNVNFMEIWPLCLKNGVRYLNTALEVWP
jgi:homospermidine synthase